jgi:hypothetical protein
MRRRMNAYRNRSVVASHKNIHPAHDRHLDTSPTHDPLMHSLT